MKHFDLFFNMKPLKKLKRSIFLIVFVVLCSGMAMAQSLPVVNGCDGSTEAKGYQIRSQSDWDWFVSDVNNGTCDYNGKWVQLKTDISINSLDKTVGVYAVDSTARRPFRGNFTGNNKTISVNLSNTESDKYTAPFVCLYGATIKKVTVTGDIASTVGKAAGLIGVTYGDKVSKVQNTVVIGVNITNGSDGSAGDCCAGVAVDGSMLEISTCIYNGKIKAGSNSAGFCAIGNVSNTKINNCFFAPASGSSITGSNVENFIANGLFNRLNTSYYTCQIGSSTQGIRAYKTWAEADASGNCTQKINVPTNSTVNYDVYAVGTGVLTLNKSKYYLNNAAYGGLSFNFTFTLATLTPTVDTIDESNYTYRVKVKNGDFLDNVSDIATQGTGTYTLVVTGRNDNTGTKEADFTVVANLNLRGNGTEASPYIIDSTANWNRFANYVTGGESFAGLYVKLNRNITVNIENSDSDNIAGAWTSDSNYKPFSGTFDGNNNTLTFNVGKVALYTVGGETNPKAPFRVINGATIKNLTVNGTIKSKYKYNAGFVGFIYGTNNSIDTCISSIVIDCSEIQNINTGNPYRKWDCSAAGFACENKSTAVVNFKNCIFDGKIERHGNANANRGAGFVSWSATNKGTLINYTHCLMMGLVDLNKDLVISNGGPISTFSRNGNNTTVKYYDACLYGPNYGDVPANNCTHASIIEPKKKEGLYRKYTFEDSIYVDPTYADSIYYVSVDIEPELHNMFYAGEPLDVSLTYYGRQLVAGTDYTIVITKKNESTGVYDTVNVINGPEGAAYQVKIEGKPARGVYGSKECEFRFMSDDEKWINLVNLINDASAGDTIKLEHNYYGSAGDSVLIINKNLVIDLNGYMIDRGLSKAVYRGQVMRISAGCDVTILNGTITGGYNQAKDDNSDPNSDTYDYKNDAGGIYNMGNLVLKDVDVVGNKCIKFTDSQTNDAATARGGGIYTGRNSSFTMIGGSVSYNIARGGGGGVYCYKPTSFSMTDVEISNNKSESKGGGIRIRSKEAPADTVCLVNCRIESNHATETDLTRGSDGGGVYMQEGLLKMVKCTIGGAEGKGNQSAFAGAGFFQMGGYTRADSCTITHNSAYTEHDRMYGGGICIKAGTYLMDSGTIKDNHSYRDGGGVYIYHGGHFKVKGKVIITDNLRTRHGAEPEDTDNNAYTDKDVYIEIVGPLTTDSKIHITGHGYGGLYTQGKDKYGVPDSLIQPDGKYQLVIIDEHGDRYGDVFLAPYEWYKGAWADVYDGDTLAAPSIDSCIVIHKAVELGPGEVGYADSIRYYNGHIIFKEGSQLICKDGLVKDSPPVEALFQKNIRSIDSVGGGWYAISLPIYVMSPKESPVKVWDAWDHNSKLVEKTSESGTDLNMDLLRYFEEHSFWDSYTDKTGNNNSSLPWLKQFTDTELGRGYLYRCGGKDRDLTIYGCIKFGDVKYKVHADCTNERLRGWNIIGNPYPHDIFKGEGSAIQNFDKNGDRLLADGFYMLEKNGAWIVQDDNTDTIKVCQGILVRALNTDTLVMHDEPLPGAWPAPATPQDPEEPGSGSGKKGGGKSEKNSIKFTVANSKYEDVTYAMFDKRTGLNKADHINEDIQMVYIRHNNVDYGIASLGDNTRSFDLCFKAKTLGTYTLKVDIEGKFNYLHLIDKLAGKDIDLLTENKYEFIGSSSDSEDRFIVRLSNLSDSDNEVFAYQNGTDIIVFGDGELQMFDVAGRLVLTQYISGAGTIRKPSQSGVYIMRLTGTDVKTQKIVVR